MVDNDLDKDVQRERVVLVYVLNTTYKYLEQSGHVLQRALLLVSCNIVPCVRQ